MKKILDHIFFLRPMLIIPMWTIMLLGMRAGTVGEGGSPFAVMDFSSKSYDTVYALILTTIIYGAVYVYNQIYDIKSDELNGKVFFLPDKIISVNNAFVTTVILNLFALVLAFNVSISLGIVTVVIVVLGILYSHPKTNFKGRAGKALWSNMFGSACLPYMIGWVFATGEISLEGILKSVPYMAAVGAIYLNTALPDRQGDKFSGKNTYAVIWDVKRTQMSALVRVFFAAVLAQLAGDYAMLISAVVVLPFLFRAYFSGKMEDSILATKIAVLMLAIFACIFFPYYAVIIILCLLVTRLYYKWRFDLAYPSLK